MQSSCPLGSTSPRALETPKILRCGSAKSWRFQEIWQSNQLKLLRWFFSLSTIVIAFWNYFHFRSRHPFVEKKNGLNFYAEKKMGQIPGAVEFGASFAELSDPSELPIYKSDDWASMIQTRAPRLWKSRRLWGTKGIFWGEMKWPCKMVL